jgi:hypothetical protein
MSFVWWLSRACGSYLPDGDIDLGVTVPANEVDGFFKRLRDTIDEATTAGEPVRFYAFINAEVRAGALALPPSHPLLSLGSRWCSPTHTHAQVKLLKLFVGDTLVDVSANTGAALSTACFLEEVDRAIGRDHLFKRSVLIVKAWRYMRMRGLAVRAAGANPGPPARSMYESRILASHHSLLSSYAVAVLVLYTINVYHHSLQTPLQVGAQA